MRVSKLKSSQVICSWIRSYQFSKCPPTMASGHPPTLATPITPASILSSIRTTKGSLTYRSPSLLAVFSCSKPGLRSLSTGQGFIILQRSPIPCLSFKKPTARPIILMSSSPSTVINLIEISTARGKKWGIATYRQLGNGSLRTC